MVWEKRKQLCFVIVTKPNNSSAASKSCNDGLTYTEYINVGERFSVGTGSEENEKLTNY